MLHHRGTGTRRMLCPCRRWMVVLAFLAKGLPSMAQHACDSTDVIVTDFPRIFGGYSEPWQQCGDTIPLTEVFLIYSYARCQVWAEEKDRSVKWSIDLREKGGCKLIAFQELVEDPPRGWKRSDVVLQFMDKKIFGLRSRDGRLILIDPDLPPFRKAHSQ